MTSQVPEKATYSGFQRARATQRGEDGPSYVFYALRALALLALLLAMVIIAVLW